MTPPEARHVAAPGRPAEVGPPEEAGRRDFLRAAAQVGGGLVLTLVLPACGPKRAASGLGGASAGASAGGGAGGQVNAWLKIAGDNTITVLVDRSEMGQGVYTALPTLLAEELEVPLTAIRIEAAPVGDAYINVGNGGQVTGTSNSVSDAWDKLRLAGARARTMLIAAGADAWGVQPADCQAEGGTVVNARGERLTYGQLAEAAAKLPVPKDVPLKPSAKFTLIGRSLPRLDTPDKCNGSAEFGIDVQRPGMLYATLAQSSVLGGTVKEFDDSAAAAMPGVRKILQTPTGIVVVADHFWQAVKARDALKISWHSAKESAGLDDAAIRASLRKTLATDPGKAARAEGDVAAALRASPSVHAATYELPLLAHATMEPMNCTAEVSAEACDLYVGTQVQQMAQAAAAEAAGLPPERVRVHTTLLGGGFGRRLEIDFIPAAVAASKAVGAPVKLIWTREDDMTHDYYRPPASIRLDGAFDAGHKLVAWRFHSVSPSITARFAPDTPDPFDSVVEGAANCPYQIPNLSVNYTRQEIGVGVGYMRSVSHAINCFAIESFMDELAHAAGKDPLAFRDELLEKKPRHRRVLQAAAELGGWGHAPAGRHLGMALMEGYTTVIAQVAEISIEQGALKIHKISCALDCGQMVNPKIVESQISGGIVFGLSTALWGEINVAGGQVRQQNFNTYRVVRQNEMPEIAVKLLDSAEPPGGIGEPSVALVAPALGNAIFAATGQRIRALPLAAQKFVKIA
jgi:isoquinoline 1-oxidoreductase beta subunit